MGVLVVVQVQDEPSRVSHVGSEKQQEMQDPLGGRSRVERRTADNGVEPEASGDGTSLERSPGLEEVADRSSGQHREGIGVSLTKPWRSQDGGRLLSTNLVEKERQD